MNKKIIAVSVLIAILFVSAIAGTIFYYNGVVNDRNSQIASLNNEIANQNAQISNLTAQVENLTSAYLVTALGATEIPLGATEIISNNPFGIDFPFQNMYNHLYITGSVTNTGVGTAYNAGLHVVAYDATGTLEINMTVPLGYDQYGAFGTDAAIDSWILSSPYGLSSLQLITLDSGQNMPIILNIFHEGTVTNWTITPVWTNSS